MTLISRFISLLLTPILIIGPLSAQTSVAPPESSSDAATLQALQVRVVEGAATDISAGSRALQGFLIEVTGSNGVAVPDAAVTVRLPDVEPTGRFADGTHAAVAYTDQSGRAKIDGIRWNAAPGAVPIRVTATKGTAHAGILIQQTLTPAGMAALEHPVSQTPTSALPPTTTPLPFPPPIDNQLLTKATTPGQPAPTAPSRDTQPSLQNPEPAVSVTSASPGETKHSSKTKWIILAAVAAAAGGVGVAMMGKKSSAANSTATGLSIGPPTVSVGHP
jgi:hypothetical protein